MSKIIPVSLLLLFMGIKIYAQTTSQAEEVTISLNQASLTSANLPFDIPFILKGKIPDNCIEIIFDYNVSSDESKNGKFPRWISLPVRENVGVAAGKSDWKKQSGDENFYLRCIGIHPDIKYDFNFQIIKDIAGDEKLKGEIKQQVAKKLLQFSTRHADKAFSSADLINLNQDLTSILNATILKTTSQTLRDRNNIKNLFAIDVKAKLPDEFNILSNQSSIASESLENLYQTANKVKLFIDAFKVVNSPLTANSLQKEVELVLEGNGQLNDFSKQLLDISVTPSIESFKSYTLRNGLLLLKMFCKNPDKLDMVLRGKSKISNNDVQASDQLDPESVEFISALFSLLDNGNLTTVAPVQRHFTQINTLTAQIQDIYIDVTNLMEAKEKIAKTMAEFPDLTLDAVISESLTAEVLTIPVIDNNNTPYISADGGIGYATAFQSVFSYYGANIYLAPVNKKASLRSFKGWNLVKKIVCINVGISSLFGDRPAHTYSLLGGTGKTDVMIGLGLRAGRVLKFNFSCMPYKLSNNPATDEKQLKFNFMAGIGVDVNLLGALGSVAKSLNLTQ